MPQFAKMHDADYLERYGSDEYDAEIVGGLPRFLNAEHREARRQARALLTQHTDRYAARFSLERTIAMYAERQTRTGVEMSDEESDAVLAMVTSEEELREAFIEELNRVAFEVTSDE